VHVAAQPALEHVFGLYLHAFGTLADFVTDLGAIVADIVLWVRFGELFKQLFGALEVFLHEDFGMVVCALGPFLAIAIHVVPA